MLAYRPFCLFVCTGVFHDSRAVSEEIPDATSLERTEGDIERRGPLPCPRPRRRGGGRGELLTRNRGIPGTG